MTFNQFVMPEFYPNNHQQARWGLKVKCCEANKTKQKSKNVAWRCETKHLLFSALCVQYFSTIPCLAEWPTVLSPQTDRSHLERDNCKELWTFQRSLWRRDESLAVRMTRTIGNCFWIGRHERSVWGSSLESCLCHFAQDLDWLKIKLHYVKMIGSEDEVSIKMMI